MNNSSSCSTSYSEMKSTCSLPEKDIDHEILETKWGVSVSLPIRLNLIHLDFYSKDLNLFKLPKNHFRKKTIYNLKSKESCSKETFRTAKDTFSFDSFRSIDSPLVLTKISHHNVSSICQVCSSNIDSNSNTISTASIPNKLANAKCMSSQTEITNDIISKRLYDMICEEFKLVKKDKNSMVMKFAEGEKKNINLENQIKKSRHEIYLCKKEVNRLANINKQTQNKNAGLINKINNQQNEINNLKVECMSLTQNKSFHAQMALAMEKLKNEHACNDTLKLECSTLKDKISEIEEDNDSLKAKLSMYNESTINCLIDEIDILLWKLKNQQKNSELVSLQKIKETHDKLLSEKENIYNKYSKCIQLVEKLTESNTVLRAANIEYETSMPKQKSLIQKLQKKLDVNKVDYDNNCVNLLGKFEMGQKNDLNNDEKSQITDLLARGKTTLQISKVLKRDHRTIKKWAHYPSKKIISQNVEKRRKISTTPLATSSKLFTTCNIINVSRNTRCRVLKTIASVKKFTSKKVKRLNWAKFNLKTNFQMVLFTDECCATLDGPDGWSRGWQLKLTSELEECEQTLKQAVKTKDEYYNKCTLLQNQLKISNDNLDVLNNRHLRIVKDLNRQLRVSANNSETGSVIGNESSDQQSLRTLDNYDKNMLICKILRLQRTNILKSEKLEQLQDQVAYLSCEKKQNLKKKFQIYWAK
ncbi:hypothetical protein A3Q56_02837 [Intoshia linei]|uniref:Uncharacterized protein n=1 Tax=Intoshia linei TaxID=1819745 RepID=A0A177B560_9BILA|nr:hypothetical protein A3Q56_02837 [Intoshia linei]